MRLCFELGKELKMISLGIETFSYTASAHLQSAIQFGRSVGEEKNKIHQAKQSIQMFISKISGTSNLATSEIYTPIPM